MSSVEGARRRRDPEQRRRAIVDAAAELIIEVGSAGLTHRLVAARAEVPLGSTTQYFATLDDLREAALLQLAEGIDSELREFSESLAAHGASPADFAPMLHAYLADERLVRADLALVSAAIVDPALRPLAMRWSSGLIELLTPHVGAAAARAVAAFIDGVAVHALLSDRPMSVDELTETLAAMTISPSDEESHDV